MGCASSVAVEDCEDRAKAESLLRDCTLGEFDSKFSVGRELGTGGFAKVRAVRRRSDREHLAVKVMSPTPGKFGATASDERNELRSEVISELRAWSAVGSSDHVVRLVTAMAERRLFFIVMERCECTIVEKIEAMPELWALQSQRILKEMLLGVQACHLADVVHRDIKPDNFLVGTDGRTVKLCDFGLAAKLPSRGQLKGTCGTVPFMSPEMLKNSAYGKATDVWSYGCTAYMLCYGELAFIPERPTRDSMRRAILAGAPPRRLQKGGGAAGFIEQLLERSPAVRPTVAEALAHPHLRGGCPARVPAGVARQLDSEAGKCPHGLASRGTFAASESTGTGGSTPERQSSASSCHEDLGGSSGALGRGSPSAASSARSSSKQSSRCGLPGTPVSGAAGQQ